MLGYHVLSYLVICCVHTASAEVHAEIVCEVGSKYLLLLCVIDWQLEAYISPSSLHTGVLDT